MQDFAGRTAVITGGANGIGPAVAQRLAREGMNLVLGDIEQPALNQVVAEFEADDVAMSETLSLETADSDRNIPERLVDLEGPSEEAEFMRQAVRDPAAGGISAGEVAGNAPTSWTI